MPRRPAKTSTTSADLAALSEWAPELAETFVALASDIALVLDEAGVILNLVQRADRPLVAADDWVDRRWADTVSEDSRAKVEQMLADVAAVGIARRREVNHPQPPAGPSVALAYTAIRLGGRGPTLAVGHGLHAQAAMQQRFLAAQQALEQSYWQSHQQAPAHTGIAANAPMIATDRARLGLVPVHAAANAGDEVARPLLRALDDLRERIGQDALPGLLRDAKRLIEQHFLQRALERGAADPALAHGLGLSRREPVRRRGRKRIKPTDPGKAGSS